MDAIRRQVASARRRLLLQQFLGVLPWTLFVALLLAAIALAVPKIWAVEWDKTAWVAGWVGGSLGAGLLAAIVWTLFVRRGAMDAAIEIDRRFGLKERVSSALSLQPTELESEAGRALIDDAERRVGKIEVRDGFHLRITWHSLLPIVPALIMFVLALLSDATRDEAQAASGLSQTRQQIKKSAEKLKKRLAKRQEDAEQKGLEDAEDLFKKIYDGVNELTSKDDVDRKKALLKMNDLAKELAKRREALGDADKMKQQLERLKNISRGPAERVAQALSQGNLEKAMEELQRLMEQLKNNELSKEDQKQLAEQLKQIEGKIREAVEAHDQAKKELERLIRQKQAEGDLETAGKLQRKLDQLQQQDRQMEKMKDLASSFGQAAQSLESGDTQGASSEIDALVSELSELQADMDSLETIDDLMSEISDAKNAMNCGQCDGEGCAGCQGFGSIASQGNGTGDGMGEGQGYGDRPEEETATNPYESRVRAKPKAGQAVRIGDAFGPNRAGMSQEVVKEEIISLLSEDAEPLTDQRLPRSQQDHVRQYYQRIGKGE